MTRIKELDYLRGFASLSIMCYHYMKWLYVYDGAQSFIGRLSVYGVEIFYILSGITLFHVYHSSLSFERNSIIKFFTKRFLRIFPLFWLSILLTIILGLMPVSIYKLFINITGLFSFIAWDKYIATGTWSIGNELVFYLLFPLFVLLYQHKRIYFFITGCVLFLVYHYFAFYIFNPNDNLHNQWTNFVNPLNHLFLFYVGMLIPIFLQHKLANNLSAICIALTGSILLFVFPSGNDGIHLLYGINRWIFSFGSILICIGFYQMRLNLPLVIDKPLKQLGEISFGVYLLHPIVYQLLCIIIRKLQYYFLLPQSNTMLILIAMLLTIFTSKLVYKYFEVYFIKIGAKLMINFYKS